MIVLSRRLLGFSVIGFLLLYSACEPAAPELPLERERLVEVLLDIHLAEAAVQELPMDRRDTVLQELYTEVLQQHDLDSAEFDSILKMLRREPDLMAPLYSTVLDSLSVRASRSTQSAGQQ